MIQILKSLLISYFLISGSVYAQNTQVYTLSADEWAQPRSGQVVASFASVRNAVEYWEKTPQSVLYIRYPGEDTGELWASELKDWLVSLGVPKDYIFMASGLDKLGEIEIVVANKDDIL